MGTWQYKREKGIILVLQITFEKVHSKMLFEAESNVKSHVSFIVV